MAAPGKLLKRALDLHRQGDVLGAGELYRQVLLKDPKNADALNLLGVVLQQAGNLDAAEALLKRAVDAAGDFAPIWVNLGNVLQEAGKPAEAVDAFQKALALQPKLAEAESNLASALNALGRFEDAVAAAERSLALHPGFLPALNNLGDAFMKAGRPADAAMPFHRAMTQAPDNPKYQRNYGSALLEAGNPQAALTPLSAACRLLPTDADAHYNRANALLALDRFNDAIAAFERTLELQPGRVDALCNLAGALQSAGRPEDAVGRLRAALEHEPDSADLHWNLSLSLLQAGDYGDGWREYEWRWQTPTFANFRRDFPAPEWDGGPLDGKRILVHAEQGFGDGIQFVRYAPMLAERGATVILECRAPLTRLFGCLSGIAERVDLGKPLPAFDLHAPLMSLPHLFGTTAETILASIPYLRPPADAKPDPRIADAPGLKVGLAWAGSPTRRDNHKRSMDPKLLQPLLDVAGVSFFSLQVGDFADQRLTLDDPGRVVDVTDGLADFADTAAAVDQLDLVISVDTSVLHLAAAMGKPVFGLMSTPTGFLWQSSRLDSPWYPTVRLFRQPLPGEWGPVVVAAREALADRAARG